MSRHDDVAPTWLRVLLLVGIALVALGVGLRWLAGALGAHGVTIGAAMDPTTFQPVIRLAQGGHLG